MIPHLCLKSDELYNTCNTFVFYRYFLLNDYLERKYNFIWVSFIFYQYGVYLLPGYMLAFPLYWYIDTAWY